MTLWILSQDKELICKAECIEIMHDDAEYAKIYLNGQFPDLIVGTYTKHRAKEVIGEIQKLLTGQNIMRFKNTGLDYSDHHDLYGAIMKYKWVALQNDATADFISPNTIVYEMPLE